MARVWVDKVYPEYLHYKWVKDFIKKYLLEPHADQRLELWMKIACFNEQ